MVETLAEQRSKLGVELDHELVLDLPHTCPTVDHLQDDFSLFISDVGVGILEEEVLRECESGDVVKFPLKVPVSHH